MIAENLFNFSGILATEITFLMRLSVLSDSFELNLSDLRFEAEADWPTIDGFISTTGLPVMSLLSNTLWPAYLIGEGS
jgi:hypothetical protein